MFTKQIGEYAPYKGRLPTQEERVLDEKLIEAVRAYVPSDLVIGKLRAAYSLNSNSCHPDPKLPRLTLRDWKGMFGFALFSLGQGELLAFLDNLWTTLWARRVSDLRPLFWSMSKDVAYVLAGGWGSILLDSVEQVHGLEDPDEEEIYVVLTDDLLPTAVVWKGVISSQELFVRGAWKAEAEWVGHLSRALYFLPLSRDDYASICHGFTERVKREIAEKGEFPFRHHLSIKKDKQGYYIGRYKSVSVVPAPGDFTAL